MARCIQLAAHGLGSTYPNPLVGSVIVHEGKIIGEGWHHKQGEPHAEIMAVNSVKNKDLLKNSTLYVNLEPCAHYGKTPPCAHRITELGIPETVIGTRDFAAHVNGKGIEHLRNNGVKVTENILTEECLWLNRRFFTFHLKKRPYIILKFAQTANGCFAPVDGSQQWITSEYSKQLVHKWRTEEQAILIGKNTFKADKPKLTARLWRGNQPLRLLISKSLDAESEIFLSDQNSVIFTEESPCNDERYQKTDFSQDIIPQILQNLLERNIQSVIIEGGAVTLNHFIQSGYWDEARILTGNASWDKGIRAPELPNSRLKSEEKINTDTLRIFVNCANDF